MPSSKDARCLRYRKRKASKGAIAIRQQTSFLHFSNGTCWRRPLLKQTQDPLFFQQQARRRHAGQPLCHSCWEVRYRKPSWHSTVPIKVQGLFALPRTGVWHGGRRSVFSRTDLHFSSPWQLSLVYKHSRTFLVWNTAKIQSRWELTWYHKQKIPYRATLSRTQNYLKYCKRH